MKNISERISALTPEQRALFDARLKQKGLRTHAAAVQTFPRRQDRDSVTCPVSIDQERNEQLAATSTWVKAHSGGGNFSIALPLTARPRPPCPRTCA